MEKTKIDKEKLMEVLKTNLASHKVEFEKAIEGYRKTAIKQLDEHIERLRAGNPVQVQIFLPMPEDHTPDYERIILQCEMSVENVITLSDREFRSYVQDNWEWKDAFLTTNSLYQGT